MYAIINRSEMALAALLTQLEGPTPAFPFVVLNLDDDAAFKALTTLELKLFYRNLGQVPGTIINQRDSIIRSIRKLIRYRPAQSLSQLDIFAQTQGQTQKPMPVRAPAGPDHTVAGTVALAPKGGVRATIWEVADRMWEAAGKPKDQKDVLALRKQIMEDLLHVSAIKKTTSSNELGNWAKSRITP